MQIIIFLEQIIIKRTMLHAETNYNSVPQLLAAFAPQYKTEHFHIHGGSHHNSAQDTLLSVFKDDTNQLHQGARLTLKGGLLGAVTGFFYYLQYGGKQTQFVHTRSVLGKINNSRQYVAFTTIGALLGVSWWVIHDMFLCPHGKVSSLKRQLFAHAIQGGLVLGTLYHPAAFGYGMIAGLGVGLMRDAINQTKLPKGFMVYFPNFDEEKRRNKLRDDEEYEMSLRGVLHTKRVFHTI